MLHCGGSRVDAKEANTSSEIVKGRPRDERIEQRVTECCTSGGLVHNPSTRLTGYSQVPNPDTFLAPHGRARSGVAARSSFLTAPVPSRLLGLLCRTR